MANSRYSDKDLKYFKVIIEEKIEEVEKIMGYK